MGKLDKMGREDESTKKNHMATSSLTIISKASALSAIR